MKDVFIIITDMGSGGAQKSLLSFLKSFEMVENRKEYSIDLMVVHPMGIFMDQIPSYVNVLKADSEVIWMGCGTSDDYLKKNRSLRGIYGKAKYSIKKRFRCNKSLNAEQILWDSWKTVIPRLKKQYDIAISYLNGYPNYYLMDKVDAKRKVLWVHNEYQKLGYDKDYDKDYYSRCDRIITISQECVNSFTEVFPEYKDKLFLLENISIASDICSKAKERIPGELTNNASLKLVSVGRLQPQKGFDIAITAAGIIKQSVPDFLWIIIGDGPDKTQLEEQIEKSILSENVKLIGVRDNPYAYISNADIFVQTSRFEGKSIVLDEAKILRMPIVVTAYPTVYDSIENGVTGSIVDIDAAAIAKGILDLYADQSRRNLYIENLNKLDTGSNQEIQKYITIML